MALRKLQVLQASAQNLDGIGDAVGHIVGDRPRKLRLEPGGGAEMMEQVSVCPANLRADGLERHGLGPLAQQETSCRIQSGGPAFLGAETLSVY